MAPSGELSLPFIYSLQSISVPEKVSLDSLKEESAGFVVTVKRNLEIFARRVHWLHSSCQDNADDLKVLNAFQKTVVNSAEELEWYLLEREKYAEEMLIFKEAFMEKIIKVLTSILDFEKQLNSIVPNLSDKIINIIGSLSIALLSIISPLSAIILRASGILESIRYVVSEGNISEQISKWQAKKDVIQERLREISERKGLIYKKELELINEIVKVTEEPAVSVAVLKLGVKELEEINKGILSNPQHRQEVKNIIELSKEVQTTSHNMSTAGTIVGSIEQGMKPHLQKLPSNVPETLQEIVTKGLLEVKTHMEGAINPDKGIIEKLDSCYKVVATIHRMKQQLDREDGSKAVSGALIESVKEYTKDVIPKKFLSVILSQELPPFKEMLGVGRVVELFFQKAGTGRAISK
jgi:hypothetical protein